MKKFFLLSTLLLSVLFFSYKIAKAETLSVSYPLRDTFQEEEVYAWVLLRRALEESGVEFTLQPSPVTSFHNKRIISSWHKGDHKINIFWAGTSKEFEQEANPVRIPIMGGLLGIRLFLIHRASQPQFESINHISELVNFTGAQGLGWSDTQILRKQGLKIEEYKYKQLYMMLNNRRFDYFPRAITEAYDELAHYGKENPSLVVEKKLALKYPFAGFFFVAKENKKLHDAIYSGLSRLHETGEFQNILRTHPATANVFQKARLRDRTIFEIENAYMSEKTLSIPEKYWFNLDWLNED